MTALQEPLKTSSHTCLNCALDDRTLPMRTKIIAGFGGATITKNGVPVYSADPNQKWDRAKTLITFEKMARHEPDADWRYELDLPLRSAVYQRHGHNKWVLIEKGLGFA